MIIARLEGYFIPMKYIFIPFFALEVAIIIFGLFLLVVTIKDFFDDDDDWKVSGSLLTYGSFIV
jgi:hypothetical protein